MWYYNQQTNNIVMEHLESLGVLSCTSENLFLPWMYYSKKGSTMKRITSFFIRFNKHHVWYGYRSTSENERYFCTASSGYRCWVLPPYAQHSKEIHIIFLLFFGELVEGYLEQVYVFCWLSKFAKRDRFPPRGTI